MRISRERPTNTLNIFQYGRQIREGDVLRCLSSQIERARWQAE